MVGFTEHILKTARGRKDRCEEEAEERNGEEAQDMCTSYVFETFHNKIKENFFYFLIKKTSFYRCTEGGRLEEADCPRGLFWSSAAAACEFPDNATCEVR